MPVHDSIWRSCEAAAKRMYEQRAEAYNLHEPEPPAMEEPGLEDLQDDAIEIAVALGIKRKRAESLVVEAWREQPGGSVEEWAAWICRNQNKR